MEALLELEDSMSKRKPQHIAGVTNSKPAGKNNNNSNRGPSNNYTIRHCINFQKYNNCRRPNCSDVHKVDPNYNVNNNQSNNNKPNNNTRDGNYRGGQDYRSHARKCNKGILKNSIPANETYRSAIRFVSDKAIIV